MFIFLFFDGNPMKASFCVPVISARTTTLFPSWRMSLIVRFRSGNVVVSIARRGFTPDGPAGVPGGEGISTQSSLSSVSRMVGSFLLNASYQRVACFLLFCMSSLAPHEQSKRQRATIEYVLMCPFLISLGKLKTTDRHAPVHHKHLAEHIAGLGRTEPYRRR